MMKNMQTAINLDDSYRGRCARCDDEMWEDCPPVEIETDIESETGVYVCEVCFEGGREWLQKQEWYTTVRCEVRDDNR